jgi:hypothetical protein
MKVAICRWRTKQNLTGTLALKTRRRLYVYEIHNYGNSFTPEMSRDKRRNHKSMRSFSYMAMFSLRNTIFEHEHQGKTTGEGYPRKQETHERMQRGTP